MKLFGCEKVTWKSLSSYIEIAGSSMHEIHFDCDLLDFEGRQKEESKRRALNLLKKLSVYVNITSDQCVETVMEYLEKKHGLNVHVYSEVFPDF